jgi:methylglutaconyl-CoA hydratase
MIVNPTEGYVRVERHGTISHIEFFHPQSNSLPSELLAALAKAIRDEGHDPAVHVIVLRSGGDTSGASKTSRACGVAIRPSPPP